MNHHTLTAAYIVISVIVFIWLGMLWSKKTAADSLVKLALIAIAIFGIILLFKTN